MVVMLRVCSWLPRLFLAVLWIAGAASAATAELDTPALNQHDVVPTLLLRCAVCHGARQQEGELDVRSRASLLRGGKTGPAIVPGKPEESLLLKKINAEEMPPRKRLVEVAVKPMEPDEVAKIVRWIASGAPEVATVPETDVPVRPEDRAFWSFRPPQRVRPPQTAHPDQVRNPIDAFVLQKLEEKGLTFASAADRLTLLRRASFDLTGLPPEPSEAAAFQADQSPDAYEKVVDRLLASPRYGERWGRHWLDVAGYADCEGRREQHLPRPVAWRYRDYVIRSFNSDKPYDRFLLEQLAGDDLADYERAAVITPEIEDNLVATAFLRMAPDPTWANLTGFVPDRLEVITDAIDVLGSGIMGLTFKCARCHHHKFDPIPQRDYYRLLAVFKGAYDEHDWLKPEINSYGGAYSAGPGERYLPYVTTSERKRWQDHNHGLQRTIDTLKAGTRTAETEKQIKAFEARLLPEPRLMALWDRGASSQTYLYRRGDYQSPGAPVEPGLPAVLAQGYRPFEAQPPWPGAKSTGRRLAFARWLTEPDHPLTARVIVNRVWKHHFGRGLVGTLGNFGKMGDRPTHPELLDWLAQEFVREGWSLKKMHRLLMTSQTYRQTSIVSPSAAQIDPANRVLSRMPMRRLSAEELRDSLLWVAGQLDETRFGRPEPVQVRADGLVQSGRRRSVYVEQLRKSPPSLMESFDLPAMNPNCLERTDSVVAPQALHLLNDPAVRTLAGQFADRVQAGSLAEQVQRIYWRALSRPPRPEEEKACQETLTALHDGWAQQSDSADPAAAQPKALTTLCHTIMNSAGFLYLD